MLLLLCLLGGADAGGLGGALSVECVVEVPRNVRRMKGIVVFCQVDVGKGDVLQISRACQYVVKGEEQYLTCLGRILRLSMGRAWLAS